MLAFDFFSNSSHHSFAISLAVPQSVIKIDQIILYQQTALMFHWFLPFLSLVLFSLQGTCYFLFTAEGNSGNPNHSHLLSAAFCNAQSLIAGKR